MIIFCWTVPVAEVDNGVFAGPAAGMVFWILLRASCDEEEKGFFFTNATLAIGNLLCNSRGSRRLGRATLHGRGRASRTLVGLYAC